ncbi:MAG: TasA family protein, partial [Clostridiales bacterium]|nr:TasA family protein [Clostridiales bacterium]
MTKKKSLVLALTIAMVAILAVGGSLAYLTDTKTATNTFTVGNVKIDLIEQQKG